MNERSGSNSYSLLRTIIKQNQRKWSFTDIIQCWLYIGHDGHFVILLIDIFNVWFMLTTISNQLSTSTINNSYQLNSEQVFQLNVSTSTINCSSTVNNSFNSMFQQQLLTLVNCSRTVDKYFNSMFQHQLLTLVNCSRTVNKYFNSMFQGQLLTLVNCSRTVNKYFNSMFQHQLLTLVNCSRTVNKYFNSMLPRALASGLSPVNVYRHNHTITALLHQHACALCALWDIWCRTLEYHSKVQ